MKLDQDLRGAEIHSTDGLKTFIKAAAHDVANTTAQRDTTLSYATHLAIGAGGLDAEALPLALRAGLEKLKSFSLGAANAATTPTAVKIGAVTSTPVVQGNAELTASRPGQTFTLKTPTLGL